MAEEHDRAIMENLYWWGIPTLFRCPNQGPDGADRLKKLVADLSLEKQVLQDVARGNLYALMTVYW